MTERSVLVVDDKVDLARGVALALEDTADVVELAHSGEDALVRLAEREYAIVLSDIRMPGMSGVELLRAVRERWPRTAVILFTAFGSVEAAVEAMKLGAYHYLTKPFSTGELTLVVERALAERLAHDELLRLRAEVTERPAFHGIVGRDRAILTMIDTITRIAPASAPVLVTGESGTGKELVARAIHAESKRRDHRFVAFSAAALPETLAEAELFGARRGAYTGADRDRVGLFEEAHQGTLFIDELSSMSLPLQGKLLRALQEGEILPLGSTTPVKVDARVVSATNEDPHTLIESGRLRKDLYYRVAVVKIQVPPLRDRLEDIPMLAEYFLARHTRATGEPRRALSPGATRLLLSHRWPGNVRELQNVIERAVLMSGEETLSPAAIELEDGGGDVDLSGELALPYEEAKTRVLERFQRRYLERALSVHGGNVSRTARTTGVTRAALYKMMRKLGLGAAASDGEAD